MDFKHRKDKDTMLEVDCHVKDVVKPTSAKEGTVPPAGPHGAAERGRTTADDYASEPHGLAESSRRNSEMDYQISTVNVNSCGLRGLSRSSSLKNSFRRHREPIWIANIRQQLVEQVKCLDFRLETHVLILSELQEFYRRRADVETEYAHSMEKLVKQTMTRHRNERQKRESWPDYSTYTVWQTLLGTTRKLGSDHGTLGELYNSQMALQMNQLSDYIQRVYKRCREMVVSSHEELIRVLTELQASLKTYQKYHGECVQAEVKLTLVEDERTRLEQSTDRPSAMLRRRLRNLEKQMEKKQLKHLECSLKAVKARNEYLLCLEAANTSIQKYFVDNVHELIDTIDFGYYDTLNQAMQMHMSAEEGVISSRKGCLDLVNRQVRGLDQATDKQSFLERFSTPFAVPVKFNFQPHQGDKVCELSVEETLQDDVLDRLGAIQERLRTLVSESNEASKMLEKAGTTFLSSMKDPDVNVTHLFQDGIQESQTSALDQAKQQSEKVEAEELYFTKFREYQRTCNLISRLQAKYSYMEKALMDSDQHGALQTLRSASMSSILTRRKEIAKTPPNIRPKLFGGSIEEYIKATGDEIPLVIRSCVRIINLYGMHHQGIFRISGSQKDINDFRNQFERGKDAFADKMDGKDMDSVAGVLKLYLRELRDPMFPSVLFEELAFFIAHRTFNEPSEVARSIYDLRHLLLSSIKPEIIIVMRYVFSFLNHLSEFSDENMMDPFNLAICLGPTLLPVPSEQDLVQYQGHVTELVKNIIIYQEDIFPRNSDGPVYEKCIIQVTYNIKSGSKNSLFEDEDMLDDIGSGDEMVGREAVALYDFQARTDRELSFKKGDSMTVFEKVSADWWDAVIKDQEGLIPDKYITLLPQDTPVSSKAAINRSKSGAGDRSPAVVVRKSPVKNPSEDLTPASSGKSCSPCLLQSDSAATSHVSSVYFCPSFISDPEPTVVCRGQDNREDVLKVDMTHKSVIAGLLLESDKGKTTEELKSDIDAALADVFSGIEFLNGTSGGHRELRAVVSEPGVRHRPDLVSDLPVNFVPSTAQKSVSTGSAAKIVTRETKTSRGAIASMHDKRTPAFHENVTVASKEQAVRPQSGNFNRVEKGRQRSTTPEGRRRSKVSSSVTQSNRHSLVPTVASDISRPSAHSRNASEIIASQKFDEEYEVWVNQQRSSSQGANIRENSSPQTINRDNIIALPVESARHVRTAFPETGGGAGAAIVKVKPLVTKAPQQPSNSANPKQSEPKTNDNFVEDCKPSFI